MLWIILILYFGISRSSSQTIEDLMWKPKIAKKEALKTTIVMLGYNKKREKNRAIIFEKYVKMDSVVDKIVFIWNNNQTTFQEHLPNGSVKIELYYGKNNSLNNRYNIRSYNIRTKSVLTIDDDVWIEESLILDMIRMQSKNPTRIIGLNARGTKNGRYDFSSNQRPRMVIGQSILWGVHIGKKYSNNRFIQNSNDNPAYFGCDDIALNALIQATIGEDALVVRKRGRVHDLSFVGGLSMQRKWLKKRSICVQYYGEYFNLTEWL